MKNSNLMQLYRIAKSYYIDNLSQGEIAVREKVSRPQISRMLKKANELGIVNIEVNLPQIEDTDLIAEHLKEHYHLKNAIVAPSSLGDSIESIYWSVCSAAAKYLETLLPQFQYVGIGWGETIMRTSMEISHTLKSSNENLTFLPLISNSGMSNPTLQSNSIIDRYSEKFQNSKRYYINCPFYLPNSSRNTMFEEMKKLWDKLEIAVFGAGGPSVYQEDTYIDELGEQKTVKVDFIAQKSFGDILANFFIDTGEIFSAPEGFSLAAVNIDQLKELQDTICIAFGEQKERILRHTICQGYIKTLITDQVTAELLLK